MDSWVLSGRTHTAHLTVRFNKFSGQFSAAGWIRPNGEPKGGAQDWQREFPTEDEARWAANE